MKNRVRLLGAGGGVKRDSSGSIGELCGEDRDRRRGAGLAKRLFRYAVLTIYM